MHLCTLHIGLPKSGSTTIQSMIFANRTRLARHGVYVPEASTNGYRNAHHHMLAWEILGRTTRKDAQGNIEALKSELTLRRTPGHILITSEYFQERLHRKPYLEGLRDLFAAMGYRLRIVAYVRPQPDYINSNYAQNVKLLFNKQGVDLFVRRALKLGRYDYTKLLLPVLELDGIETVYRPFNRETLERGISKDFLATIGLNESAIAGMKISMIENTSPGPKTLAVCLAVSRRLAKLGIVLDDDDRNRASRTIQDLGEQMGWNAVKFSGISKHNARLIQKRFATSNDEFASAVWDRKWDEVFGENCWSPAPYNVFHPNKSAGQERIEFKRATQTAWKLLKFDKFGKPDRIAAVRPVPNAP